MCYDIHNELWCIVLRAARSMMEHNQWGKMGDAGASLSVDQ